MGAGHSLDGPFKGKSTLEVICGPEELPSDDIRWLGLFELQIPPTVSISELDAWVKSRLFVSLLTNNEVTGNFSRLLHVFCKALKAHRASQQIEADSASPSSLAVGGESPPSPVPCSDECLRSLGSLIRALIKLFVEHCSAPEILFHFEIEGPPAPIPPHLKRKKEADGTREAPVLRVRVRDGRRSRLTVLDLNALGNSCTAVRKSIETWVGKEDPEMGSRLQNMGFLLRDGDGDCFSLADAIVHSQIVGRGAPGGAGWQHEGAEEGGGPSSVSSQKKNEEPEEGGVEGDGWFDVLPLSVKTTSRAFEFLTEISEFCVATWESSLPSFSMLQTHQSLQEILLSLFSVALPEKFTETDAPLFFAPASSTDASNGVPTGAPQKGQGEEAEGGRRRASTIFEHSAPLHYITMTGLDSEAAPAGGADQGAGGGPGPVQISVTRAHGFFLEIFLDVLRLAQTKFVWAAAASSKQNATPARSQSRGFGVERGNSNDASSSSKKESQVALALSQATRALTGEGEKENAPPSALTVTDGEGRELTPLATEFAAYLLQIVCQRGAPPSPALAAFFAFRDTDRKERGRDSEGQGGSSPSERRQSASASDPQGAGGRTRILSSSSLHLGGSFEDLRVPLPLLYRALSLLCLLIFYRRSPRHAPDSRKLGPTTSNAFADEFEKMFDISCRLPPSPAATTRAPVEEKETIAEVRQAGQPHQQQRADTPSSIPPSARGHTPHGVGAGVVAVGPGHQQKLVLAPWNGEGRAVAAPPGNGTPQYHHHQPQPLPALSYASLSLRCPMPSFDRLLAAVCSRRLGEHLFPLLLYALVHRNRSFKLFCLSRSEPERLLLPLLECLSKIPQLAPRSGGSRTKARGRASVGAERKNSAGGTEGGQSSASGPAGRPVLHQLYAAPPAAVVLLLVLLALSSERALCQSLMQTRIGPMSHIDQRAPEDATVGALVLVVLVRLVQWVFAGPLDPFLVETLSATLCNLSETFRHLDWYSANKIVSLLGSLCKSLNRLLGLPSDAQGAASGSKVDPAVALQVQQQLATLPKDPVVRALRMLMLSLSLVLYSSLTPPQLSTNIPLLYALLRSFPPAVPRLLAAALAPLPSLQTPQPPKENPQAPHPPPQAAATSNGASELAPVSPSHQQPPGGSSVASSARGQGEMGPSGQRVTFPVWLLALKTLHQIIRDIENELLAGEDGDREAASPAADSGVTETSKMLEELCNRLRLRWRHPQQLQPPRICFGGGAFLGVHPQAFFSREGNADSGRQSFSRNDHSPAAAVDKREGEVPPQNGERERGPPSTGIISGSSGHTGAGTGVRMGGDGEKEKGDNGSSGVPGSTSTSAHQPGAATSSGGSPVRSPSEKSTASSVVDFFPLPPVPLAYAEFGDADLFFLPILWKAVYFLMPNNCCWTRQGE
uniref:Dymeclin n=1 Tax=Chromera velia CCMP2878 TaxID=1169474 RepID=A0A0G4GYX4_9ALVE|eukprot:Cvel_5400.t1-p1 / transcript=Cvel_5400.t1 / gene=Cvel_5400 / organism=Chromera_velia_CCMP2878 / gene_product=hypothetical protein / transcript_product=hypothetical protein / location=Cvel_scaffold251:56662-70456(-) / protein_length=1409 / sequence_SO=supercontig / SO=protein_coding / is_pseudo=false